MRNCTEPGEQINSQRDVLFMQGGHVVIVLMNFFNVFYHSNGKWRKSVINYCETNEICVSFYKTSVWDLCINVLGLRKKGMKYHYRFFFVEVHNRTYIHNFHKTRYLVFINNNLLN